MYGYLEALNDHSNASTGVVDSFRSISYMASPASDPITPSTNKRQQMGMSTCPDFNSTIFSEGYAYAQPYPVTPTPQSRRSKKTNDAYKRDEIPKPITFTRNVTDEITGLPKPFVPPNMKLVRSIDHSRTNPSNDLRLKCPYPAPADIFTASQAKYLDNVTVHNQKVAAGASPESNRIPFTIFEDDAIIRHMLDVSKNPDIPATEQRFEVVSQRLIADGMPAYRTKTAIKNMWCRVGRGRSGFDERKGVRKDSAHVVNGWKAKPGSKRKRSVDEDEDDE